MELSKALSFYSIRFLAVFLALYFGWLLVKDLFISKIFDPICLTNTDKCSTIELYLYKNTFVAKEEISQIYFWYNGFYLYVYGQSAGTCSDNYQPVNVFTLKKDKDKLNFTRFPNECVTSLDYVITYYKNLGVEKQTYYLSQGDQAGTFNNIFSVINNMVDNKIFEL